jgi:hypothetical protein
MSFEKPSNRESLPENGVDQFEKLVNAGTWDEETIMALEGIFETYPDDLYMLYLNYTESGLVEEGELPEHELRMYEWLKEKFESEE